jgi:4-hydroxy 2-oxovalerate aldolase
MTNIEILDCTLRDGGYYNNWRFSRKFASEYLKTISKTSVKTVEIGFRKPINNSGSGPSGLKKIGNFLTSSEKFLNKLSIPKNITLGVMIDLSDYINKDFKKNLDKNFPDIQHSKVKYVRIACNFSDANHLLKIIKFFKNKNYRVAANLMKFTMLTNKQLNFFLNKANNAGADTLYLADSFGNCKPEYIKTVAAFLKKKKFNLNKIGFHSHDNTGNALTNSIEAFKCGFGSIDTSVLGMGRGSGNLKLEDFLKFLKKKNEIKLLKAFNLKHMKPLKIKYKWGKNQFYNYSAKNQIHPTFVQRLLEEKKFKKNLIIKILKFLKANNATQYDTNIFDNFFLKTSKIKSLKINFDKKIAIFCDNKNNKKINIQNLKSKGYTIASLNLTKFIKNKNLDLVFSSNAYRVFTEIEEILKLKKVKLIIPKYNLLKNFFKKNKNKIIYYNIIKKKNLCIKKKYCAFNKNLVLVYALSFCLSNNYKNITLFGMTKNLSNLKIIKMLTKKATSAGFKFNLLVN